MSESHETRKQSVWDMLGPKNSFIVGSVGGLFILCTIGFFVLLSMVMSGNSFSLDDESTRGDDSVSGQGNSETVSGPKEFSQCLDSGKLASKVQADEQLGVSLGVNGTPATFINGYLVSGALPYEAIKDVVEDALNGRPGFIDNFEQYGMESGELQKVEMPTLPDVVWKGNAQSNVAIVEFSDFECPYCNRFAPTLDQIMAQYSDKVKFTYRHFPLSFHSNAQKAAEAYECAKAQGKAFEMHDKLFELSRNSSLSINNYKKAATELGLK